METIRLIKLSLVFFILTFTLINNSQCKPGWSLQRLSVWGKRSSTSSQSQSDSSVKHFKLCEYVCKKEPEEGQKYCDCDTIDSSMSPESTSSEAQEQISLSDYFKQETNQSMKRQMCSLLCSEDSTEASNYCNCSASGKTFKGDSPSTRFQTISEYFKKDHVKSNSVTRQQLCSYLCSDDPDEAEQHCNCTAISKQQENLIAKQSQLYSQLYQQDENVNLNNQQRQGQSNPGNNNNMANNQFSIKNLLPLNHGHSQEDLCKIICAVEPDNDNGQCGCNDEDDKKESQFVWPWRRIKNWFG